MNFNIKNLNVSTLDQQTTITATPLQVLIWMSDQERDLGIIVDNKLKFHIQTAHIVNKAGYKTGARYSQNASVKGSGRVPKSVHSPVISSTKKRSDIGVACTTIYL